MRQYLIDDLTREERANIESFLKRTLQPAAIEGLFWLPVPPDLWSAAQQGHDSCGPFHFAVELAEDSLRFEFLVRSETNLHCSCIAYATPAQRQFVLNYIDRLLEEELIRA